MNEKWEKTIDQAQYFQRASRFPLEKKTLVAYACRNNPVFIRFAASFYTKFCFGPFYLFSVLAGIIGNKIWEGYFLEWWILFSATAHSVSS